MKFDPKKVGGWIALAVVMIMAGIEERKDQKMEEEFENLKSEVAELKAQKESE